MDGKKAKDRDEAWKLQDTQEGKPHGWIQWKGTDVCMDVYCKCGVHAHIDDTFVYFVKCANCGTIFMLNAHIEFIEIAEAPKDVTPIQFEE